MNRTLMILLALVALLGLGLFFMTSTDLGLQNVDDEAFLELLEIVREGDWGDEKWESLGWIEDGTLSEEYEQRMIGEWADFCPDDDRLGVHCVDLESMSRIRFGENGMVKQVFENSDLEIPSFEWSITWVDTERDAAVMVWQNPELRNIFGRSEYVIKFDDDDRIYFMDQRLFDLWDEVLMLRKVAPDEALIQTD